MVGEYLFSDPDFVLNLSTKHRNIFEKIYDEIKYLYKVATAGSKEARELEKVKRAFENAYRESGKAQTDTKYSIVQLEDGKVYVEASRKVINGNTRAEQRREITDFFSKLLEENPSLDIHTIEGDVLTITKAETANKARDDYKTADGQKVKMSDNEFAVKLNVEAHIDEVAEVSTKIGKETDSKNHSFAKDGFTYRRAYFKDFDGQYYEVTLSIGNNGTVATVYNVGKTKESVSPSAKIIAAVGSKPLGKTLSSNSLPQNGTNVNTKFSISSDTNGKQLSEAQREYFKDSKVVDENGNLKVMYHGTSKGGYTVFDTYGSNYGLFGQGSYFTDNKSVAESYTKKGKGNNPQVYETYLNITNPMDMDAQADAEAWRKAFPDADFPESGTNEDFYRAIEEYYEDEQYPKWEAAAEAMETIMGMGYDGITHIGGGRVNADGIRHQVYIAFNPEQIKNTDNVKPTNSADIRYSLSSHSDDVVSLDKYTEKQYNDFGWARDAEAISVNELDDVYSKIQEKGSLKKFAQSSKGEAIIEVNDKPHSTLGVDNVFIFVTGTKNSPKISKVVRFQAETDTEMEIIKEKLYERGAFSNSYYSFLKQYGFAREYSKQSALDYTEYEEKVRRRNSGAESSGAYGTRGNEQNGRRTPEQTQSNEIAPINETSSTDGVFFDGDNPKYSLSSDTNGKQHSESQRDLLRIEKQFAKVYRDAQKIEKKASDGTQYSLSIKYTDGSIEELADARWLTNEQAIDYLKRAKRGELRRDTYIPVRKDTPQVIIDTLNDAGETAENLSLIMQVRKAQQAMSTKNAGNRLGNNVRSHSLSPEEVVEVVNKLDNPNTIILQTNRQDKDGNPLPNNVAVFVDYSTDSKEGLAVIEFEGSINPEFIGTEFGDTSYHTVVTVFEPDVERNGVPFDYAEELLSNPNNIELEIKRRQIERSATGEKLPNTSNELPSDGILPQTKENVNRHFSLSTDSKGVNEQFAPTLNDVPLQDLRLEAPIRKDVAPVGG